ncbi:hypothetical protein [Rhodopila globiformis]|uniref:hypothetical protein n=1 Tax=Rhodopila globiformis TaxID=1071 RepID=UPI0011B0E3F7|nr:hypothetical protein [Rhodopila globiformis]
MPNKTCECFTCKYRSKYPSPHLSIDKQEWYGVCMHPKANLRERLKVALDGDDVFANYTLYIHEQALCSVFRQYNHDFCGAQAQYYEPIEPASCPCKQGSE